MSLQEPVLRAAGLAFRLTLAPRFPDVRGLLTDVLLEVLHAGEEEGESDIDWFWDSGSGSSSPAVFAWDETRRLNISLAPRRLDILSEAPDVQALNSTARHILGPCLDILGLSEAIGCSATATWTLAAEQAADAEQALEEWVFQSSLRKTFEPLGGRPDDLVFEATFAGGGDVATSFRAEPVTDEQASEGPFFLSEFEVDEFPPGALLVQVERHQNSSGSADDAVERAERHLDKVLDQTDRLLATLEARDDAR